MTKFFFTLGAITLLQISTWAQPVATSSNVAANFNADFYYADATGFTPGSAGPNQTWDYSGLQINFLGTDTALPVAGSPFASSFPTANYLYKFNGIFEGGERYFYHNLTPASFEILSLGYNGTDGDVFTPNPKTYVTFPYTYNTVFTDTYQTTSEPASTSFTATYDAYGTLIMPFGTFNNVIRQKVVTNGQTDYNYFNVSPFYPILQTVLAENTLGIIIDNTQLSVIGNDLSSLSVYPNPVKDNLYINLPAGMTGQIEISLFDISGKILQTENQVAYEGNSLIFDVQHFSPGVYFLKISQESTSTVISKKIVKG